MISLTMSYPLLYHTAESEQAYAVSIGALEDEVTLNIYLGLMCD